MRFRDRGIEDILEEFMKRGKSVEEYQDKFEDVRIRMKRVIPQLGEDYWLEK